MSTIINQKEQVKRKMNVEFKGFEEVPNKLNPSSAVPLAQIKYSLGKKDIDWQFGVSRARVFVRVHDDAYQEYLDNKDNADILWKHVIEFTEGQEYVITRTKMEVLHHYIEDIREFCAKYTTPAEAISEPMIKIIEDQMTGDYINTLLLPCYQKGPFDVGEGLLPLKLTQKQCRYLFDLDSTGVTIKDVRMQVKENPGKPLVKHIVTRDGRDFDVNWDVDKLNCVLKYKQIIQNFKDNPDEIDAE